MIDLPVILLIWHKCFNSQYLYKPIKIKTRIIAYYAHGTQTSTQVFFCLFTFIHTFKSQVLPSPQTDIVTFIALFFLKCSLISATRSDVQYCWESFLSWKTRRRQTLRAAVISETSKVHRLSVRSISPERTLTRGKPFLVSIINWIYSCG